ncbi:4Fe-4S dicluster protein [Keratinibaculum paraultunense]|uniref:4Fe-4S dicluster protein n=3 Tax=Keratinibaculum paraultunense TaxID=1278232 RepID=A0A4R3KQB9_9FIRM|nr:4Fe-4S dicluster protein [Keratinibaculum paraultunense]
MSNVTINIDGQDVTVPRDYNIIQAAEKIGIEIPALCYDKNLSPFGGCRLCLVEIKGYKNLVASCSTKVKEGMEIYTESEKVVKVRKDILDLLLSNHPMDCLTCDKVGECKLQDYAYKYNIKGGSFKGEKKNYAIDSLNPVMERDQNKCILCGKCVRVCKEIQISNVVDFVGRGFNTKVTTAFDEPIDYENCRLCGQCISVCPTGALINKQFKGIRPWEVEKVRTTCPFCGTGCNFDLNIKDGKVVGVTPNPESPVNGTSLCVKGRYHTDFINSPDRLTTPLIKKKGKFVEASWEEAMALVVENLQNAKRNYGPDSIVGLSSARCTNEENFVFQKMMRVAIGTNNVDHCART